MKKCVVFLVNFASEIWMIYLAENMTRPNLQNKKVMALALVTVITVMSFLCSHPNHSELLAPIDSLLVKKEFRLALDRLNALDRSEFNKRDHAYYNLLLTQAEYQNNVPFTNDSVINEAVHYYNHADDKEKYTRALIYKGCVNEKLGKPEKAIECYKMAEGSAEESDLANRAFTAFRMARLYHSQYSGPKTIAANKYKDALKLYQELDDRHYIILCYGEIGELYGNSKEKSDSALYYLNTAIKLSEEQPDEQYRLFSYYTARGQYYNYVKRDYHHAINDILKAISLVDTSTIDHARAHICLADAYIHLGMKDSCDYYIKRLPRLTTVADTIFYHRLLADIYQFRGDIRLQYAHAHKASQIGDSVLLKSVNHKLLAVEKRYDLQNEELQNAKLRSNLNNTWMALAILAAIGFGLLSIVLGYRSRLRNKEHEFELLKADLDSSASSLRQVQASLSSYEEDMNRATSTISRLNQEIDAAHRQLSEMETERTHYQKNVESSQQSITQLNDQIAMVKDELTGKEMERDELSQRLEELEHKKSQSDEIMSILDGQIKVVHQLMQWAYEFDGNTFAKKFNSLMTIQEKKDSSSYWSNLQSLVNDLYDNVLIKAQEQAGGTLREDELNFIALYCCGFSRTAIMVCMNYKHIVTISNKKVQIAKKLGINNLDDFVAPYQDKKTFSKS